MPHNSVVLTFTVRDPARLDDCIASFLPKALEKGSFNIAVSKSKIRRLIVSGAVSVNGRPMRGPGTILRKGSIIEISFDEDKFSHEKAPDDIAFELHSKDVLFEDDSIIVVNKPAGLPTEATIVGARDHLHAAVARYTGSYVGLHHRLDRETSGVILFTKTEAVNAAVHAMFLAHEARKEYLALTAKPDALPPVEFSVENLLDRISAKSAAAKWGAVLEGGKPAFTEFTIVESKRGFLVIKARPITGRTHQIRVHLSGLGMPLLGDALYGGPASVTVASVAGETPVHSASAFIKKKPASGNAGDGILPQTDIPVPRVMLHATSLSLVHPVTGERITVEAPIPKDMGEIIDRGL
jgi:23S rRNA pseudouridine1911/1915/1917 synthase